MERRHHFLADNDVINKKEECQIMVKHLRRIKTKAALAALGLLAVATMTILTAVTSPHAEAVKYEISGPVPITTTGVTGATQLITFASPTMKAHPCPKRETMPC